MPFPLLHGPLLYLYARALSTGPFRLWIAALHFIPVTAMFVYLIPFFLLSIEQKEAIFENSGRGYETFSLVRHITINISGIAYLVLSTLVLRDHRRTVRQEFSSTEKVNLLWLQYLIIGLAIIWLLVLFANDEWVFAASVFFLVFIGYFGIRQVGIFTGKPEAIPSQEPDQSVPPAEEGPSRRKYLKSGLSAEKAAELHRELTQLMVSERPFRESELMLADLAVKLNTLPNHLSQLINEREGKSFYDYINTLRIEEFIRLASGPDSRRYSLMGLAQECGFSSKSSFIRYCRKVTGKSPSEFLEGVTAGG
jgi:AraC-like DNA-binding protein